MILQALKEYYDRKVVDGSIARDGWIRGGLDFLLVLDLDGKLLNINDLRESNGRKKVPRLLNLPNIGKQALKHTNSGKDANLLWDNASFVFGLGDKGQLRLQSMISTIDNWFGEQSDPGIKAVHAFLTKGLKDRNHFNLALEHPEYGETFMEGSVKISFRVLETNYNVVFDSPVVVKTLVGVGNSSNTEKDGICLVTGEQDAPIEMTHSVIKGVWGAQSSGACIVSFNNDTFNSYGKTQCLNAPVSKTAASQYSKAVNFLLDSTSQRMQVGNTSVVFWSERRSSFESDFSFFFNEPEKDNPDSGTQKIRVLFESVKTGAYMEDNGEQRFYVLGLAPNAARIAIRLWKVGTISEFADNIRRHFEDLRIIKPDYEPEFYSIWKLLANVSSQDDIGNLPPKLAGDYIRAILEGFPYPTTVLQAVLGRIRCDVKDMKGKPKDRINSVRAAIIKSYLNRYQHFYDKKHKELTMALDINQPSVGYQLGRLFATLAKIQDEAQPGINATIRERFYGAACASPVTVFANLLKLMKHHLAKLPNKGRAITFERLVGEIMSHLSDFPAHLDLHEQGRFAIGYYHQWQDFFPKSNAKGTSEKTLEAGAN